LLRELLKTQKQVRTAGKAEGVDFVELIGLDELQEIRRIWVADKGEIEDLLPGIYEEAIGAPYPGKELDPMPLDAADLEMLRGVAAEWIAENLPAEEEATNAERAGELYKLTRTLLATAFRGLQSRKRSKQLDQLQTLLSAFAFVDEQDALEFAKAHLSDAATTAAIEVPEALLEDELGDTAPRTVIPIVNASSVAG
jgi:DNA sulfur modification protein DndC